MRELKVLFLYKILGGVMITQVSLDVNRSVQDPRRKAQSMRFENNPSMPKHVNVRPNFIHETRTSRENAVWTVFSLMIGAFAFVFGSIIVAAKRI
jgi:hypothetical protein